MPVKPSRLIRSKRRTIALIVERDGSVTVRAPTKMSVKAIDQFVQKHSKWVEKKQIEMQSFVPAQPRKYKAGETFLYLGQAYPLEIVRDAEHTLTLDGSFKLVEKEQAHAQTIFRDWYRKQATRLLGERVAYFAEQFGLNVDAIRITSARTRWGSCSSKGALSFSWRLLMTPPRVIDYVVIHELAHTVQHNHSARFWKLVEEWMPDYHEQRNRLKQYGHENI